MFYNGSRKIRIQVINNITYYVKELSEQEIIAEVIASRLGKILNFNAVENYQRDMQTLYSKKYDQAIDETIVDSGYNLDKVITESIYDMCIFDYLTINRDRHIKNIEILEDRRFNTYRLSSLFDFNISLLSTTSDEALSVVDWNYDPITQNFNNKTLLQNLQTVYNNAYYKEIPKDKIYLFEFVDLFTNEEFADPYINNRISVLLDSINIRIERLINLGILQAIN